MTVKATITAHFREARRIAEFMERDYADEGVAVALVEVADETFRVESYFPEGDPEWIARRICDGLGSDCFLAPLDVALLPETDWVAESLKGLKPVAAGRFVVHGSHDRDVRKRGRIAIEIEAGQAFGTGHHGTTAGCLEEIDRLARSGRIRHALDLGTGSGVLAIAIAKRIRCPVLATDNDPLACRIAAENARRNGVERLVGVAVADGLRHQAVRARAPFDLVVANILAEPLRRLAPTIAASVAPRGTLVLSGLLPRQRDAIAAAYRAQGMRLRRSRVVDGWGVLTLVK